MKAAKKDDKSCTTTVEDDLIRGEFVQDYDFDISKVLYYVLILTRLITQKEAIILTFARIIFSVIKSKTCVLIKF